MSEQTELLHNVILSAQQGNDAAVCLLRDICEKAATNSPREDLISMAWFLYDLGLKLESAK